MENLKFYKSKYKYINDFLLDNNIIIIFGNKKDRNKVALHEFIHDNQEYTCIVMDSKINNDKKFEILKTITFNIIKREIKSNYLYVDKRYNLENDIFISNTLDIKFKKVDTKLKNKLIAYNYFKIKDLIKRLGYYNFYNQYQIAKSNEILSSIYHKLEKN